MLCLNVLSMGESVSADLLAKITSLDCPEHTQYPLGELKAHDHWYDMAMAMAMSFWWVFFLCHRTKIICVQESHNIDNAEEDFFYFGVEGG